MASANLEGLSYVRDGSAYWIEVTNPETGRPIYLGGPTYNDLVRRGVINPHMLGQLNPREAVRNVDTGRLDLLHPKGHSHSQYQSYQGSSTPTGMSTKIINPETGHRITVGGAEYNDLVQRGVIDPSRLSMYNPEPAMYNPSTGRADLVGGRALSEGRMSPTGSYSPGGSLATQYHGYSKPYHGYPTGYTY